MGDGLLGLFGRIGRGTQSLFGGPGDPRLSPQENQNATREAVLRAGLGAIIGSGPGSQGTLPTLAQAVLLGRDTGAATRTASVQKQGQGEIATLLQQGGIDANGLRRALITAVTTGDMETARTIASVLPSLQTAEAPQASSQPNRQQVDTVVSAAAGAPPQVVQALGEGTRVSVQRDPLTGRVYWESAIPTPPPQAGFADARVIKDETSPTGWSYQGFDRTLGVERVVQGAPPPGGSGGTGNTAQERLNNRLAGVANSANQQLSSGLDERLAGVGANLAAVGGPIGWIANYFQSNEGQLAGQIALQFLNPTVRYLSGAQMTEQESRRYYRALMPRFGDREAAMVQKRRARQDLVDAMESGELPSTREEALELLDRNGLSLPTTDDPLPWEQGATGGGSGYDDLIPR